MSSLKETLSPSRQTPVQRRGFFGSLTLASLVLLLHFPFDGYDNEHLVTTYHGNGPCPNLTIEGLRTQTAEQADQYHKDIKRCSDDTEMQLRPFSEWRSKAPIIEWFGSVVHGIAALAFSLLLGGIWLWVFRTSDDD